MRVLFDQGTPVPLRRLLSPHQVETAFERGWSTLKNSDLDEWIRHRLRMVQLKQWKRGKTIYREMKRLGANEEAARQVAGNSRRWWKNSSKLLNTALPTSYYDKEGVPRLAA